MSLCISMKSEALRVFCCDTWSSPPGIESWPPLLQSPFSSLFLVSPVKKRSDTWKTASTLYTSTADANRHLLSNWKLIQFYWTSKVSVLYGQGRADCPHSSGHYKGLNSSIHLEYMNLLLFFSCSLWKDTQRKLTMCSFETGLRGPQTMTSSPSNIQQFVQGQHKM